MSSGPSPERPQTGVETAGSGTRSLSNRQIASAIVVVLVLVFALINLQSVPMHWIVGTTHTPLIVMVAFCVLIGLAVGFVLGRRSRADEESAKKRR